MNQEPRTRNQRINFINLLKKNFLVLLTWSLVLGSWSITSYAANYDIKEMTPEVREALAGRQTRYSELQSAKRSKTAHENDQGYVDCKINQSLCSAENHDRQTIYRAIADQNGLGTAGLSQIQRTFAETIRERERH